MISILCYGDSNTYGSNPEGEPHRHPYHVRWPGLLQGLLGEEYYVIEEGMGGRTTVWEDPLEPGRCGLTYLPVALQTHAPLDLVILSLGTNDCKNIFHAPPRAIARGMECLINMVKRFGCGSYGRLPQILVISPILMGPDIEHSVFATFDKESARKAMQLGALYQTLAKTNHCLFLDAAAIAKPGKDQLHMDAASHKALAEAVSGIVRRLF